MDPTPRPVRTVPVREEVGRPRETKRVVLGSSRKSTSTGVRRHFVRFAFGDFSTELSPRVPSVLEPGIFTYGVPINTPDSVSVSHTLPFR